MEVQRKASRKASHLRKKEQDSLERKAMPFISMKQLKFGLNVQYQYHLTM